MSIECLLLGVEFIALWYLWAVCSHRKQRINELERFRQNLTDDKDLLTEQLSDALEDADICRERLRTCESTTRDHMLSLLAPVVASMLSIKPRSRLEFLVRLESPTARYEIASNRDKSTGKLRIGPENDPLSSIINVEMDRSHGFLQGESLMLFVEMIAKDVVRLLEAQREAERAGVRQDDE